MATLPSRNNYRVTLEDKRRTRSGAKHTFQVNARGVSESAIRTHFERQGLTVVSVTKR